VLHVGGEVGVVLADHAGVHVPEQLRDVGDGNAVDKGLGRVAVPCRVTDDPFQVRQLLPQVSEPAPDAVAGESLLAPWPAEERPVGVLPHQPAGQLDHRRRQVEDAGLAGFRRRLVLGQGLDAEVEVDVGGRHRPQFARPRPGFQHGEHELAEVCVGDGGENRCPLLRREHAVAATLRRLLDRLDRVGLEQPLGVGPVEGPLDRDDGVVAGCSNTLNE
jgi:hypothetical protein